MPDFPNPPARDGHWTTSDPLVSRVTLIADDLGRLQRMNIQNHVIDRLCNHLETLDALVRPTAGERVRAGETIHDALAAVDQEHARLHQRLHIPERHA